MLHYLQDLFDAMDFHSLGSAVLRVTAVFLCLTVHEACHGLAAYILGDPTAKKMKRLSLNPLHHVDWFGLAMMFVAGFGWAKPVPIDPRYFRKPKQGMAITALSGPISNLFLAALAMIICRWIYQYAPYTDGWNLLFEFLLHMVAPLSIGLGVFNLLPFPPLDGAKVLGALLPERVYFHLMQYERYGMLLLFLLVFTGFGDGFINTGIHWIYGGLLKFLFEV